MLLLEFFVCAFGYDHIVSSTVDKVKGLMHYWFQSIRCSLIFDVLGFKIISLLEHLIKLELPTLPQLFLVQSLGAIIDSNLIKLFVFVTDARSGGLHTICSLFSQVMVKITDD